MKVDDLVELANATGGYVTSADAARAGFNAELVSQAARRGVLERRASGIYKLPDAWDDEFYELHLRFGRGVFSHETAASILHMSERLIQTPTMTFPCGYNTSKALAAGVDARTVRRELHTLGATSAKTIFGNDVAVYDRERTLCDLLRRTSQPNLETFVPAIQGYMADDGKDLTRLVGYARELNVLQKIRPYLEVL